MLQDPQTFRHYQQLTDALTNLWHQGHRYDDIRLYVDGYLLCLRQTQVLDIPLVHRLEEEIFRFMRDPSNFELSLPHTQTEIDYY